MCKKISKEQAQEFMDEAIRIFFKTITRISKNKKREEKRHAMPKSEVECITRSLALKTGTQLEHGMSKLHK